MLKKRPKSHRKQNNNTAAGLQILRTVAFITAKHRRHAKVLALLLIIGVLGAGMWLGQAYWHMKQLREAQSIINSKYEGIKIESTSYNGDSFLGYVAYATTENHTINSILHDASWGYFQPCKDNALRDRSAASECHVAFTIDFATTQYLQVTYTFETYRNKSLTDTKLQSFLFDRQSGSQLHLESLFKSDTNYLEILAKESRKHLVELFKEEYEQTGALRSDIEKLTKPLKENFDNFALTEDEKLSLSFNSLAGYMPNHSTVTILIDSNVLFSLFNDQTLGTFFPKLKEQKEAERRLAEEAKRKAEEAASQADAARNHTRQQVAANRSNINCAAMKCIALTFDDGPGAYTNQIIDALTARNAVATFFVLGNKVASSTGTLQRAVNTHNEIANHSWSHPDFTRLSNADIGVQVEQTNQAIFNAVGSYPKLMRPPYAALDGRVVSQIGMPIALWSVDPQDWLYRDASTVYRNVISRASPGSVVVLHDIHPTTAQAVPAIIDELQRQGYVLVTMSELLDINQNNVLNFAGHTLRRR